MALAIGMGGGTQKAFVFDRGELDSFMLGAFDAAALMTRADNSCVRAPTGRNVIAQGSALGQENIMIFEP